MWDITMVVGVVALRVGGVTGAGMTAGVAGGGTVAGINGGTVAKYRCRWIGLIEYSWLRAVLMS